MPVLRVSRIVGWRLTALFAFGIGIVLGTMIGSLLIVNGAFSPGSCGPPSAGGQPVDPGGGGANSIFEDSDSILEGPGDNAAAAPAMTAAETPAMREAEEIDTSVEDLQDQMDVYRQLLPEDVRPRKLVLVGVMTAAKFIDTRALAGYETWGRRFKHVIYFSSEGTVSKYGLPVVGLTDIDDEYPPQRKAFAMLRYMVTHFGQEYQFFMRLDDDVYIRPHRLHTFLSKLRRNVDLYVGSPGVGKKKEREVLDVTSWFYCMGGPGVIFSHTALTKLVPHIDDCLENMMQSTHEDVEVGRCLHSKLGLSCSDSLEFPRLFFHGFKASMIFSSQVYLKDLRYAVTVHPLKDPSLMYQVHDFYVAQDSLQKEQLSSELLHTLSWLLNTLNRQSPQAVSLQTKLDAEAKQLRLIQQPFKKASMQGAWNLTVENDHFTPSLYHPSDHASEPEVDFKSMPFRPGLKGILGRRMRSINARSRTEGIQTSFVRLHEGYAIYDPLLGFAIITDSQLLLKKRLSFPEEKNEVLKMWQEFAPVVASKQRFAVVPSRKPMTLLVTVAAARAKAFQGFAEHLLDKVLKPSPEEMSHTRLLVVLFKQRVNGGGQSVLQAKTAVELVRNVAAEIRAKHPRLAVNVHVMRGDVSASQAIRYAITTGVSDDPDGQLLLTMDESVRFGPGLLQRCRQNSKAKNSVYFPYVFGLYDPSLLSGSSSQLLQLSPERGTWLTDYFGVACFHSSDLQVSDDLLNATSSSGEEEMAAFADGLVAAGMDLVRAPDPMLVREHIPVQCPQITTRARKKNCSVSVLSRQGTKSLLLKGLQNHRQVQNDWRDLSKYLAADDAARR